MPPEINTIFIGGIRIDEPIVTLTDLMFAALSFYYFFKLKDKASEHPTYFYFKYYFLLMGIAVTFGGLVGHAFLYALPFSWKLLGWVISMVAIMMIERAAITHTSIILDQKITKYFSLLNIIEFLIFLFLTLYTLDFAYVELHSAYGLMVVFFSLELFLYIKTKNEASRLFLIMIIWVALAAFVFIQKISLHQWVNHISLSHIFIFVGTIILYRGIEKMELKSKS